MLRAQPELPDDHLWQAHPTIVVPCYNEEFRLPQEQFSCLARTKVINILFVDDGSTDRTVTILKDLEKTHSNVRVLGLETNVGKGEAVRFGIRYAMASGAEIVGYYDADMSTPSSELLRLIGLLQDNPSLDGVLGCRVARLGSDIIRSPFRHYVGRSYATLASIVLRLGVYDTQCGAKVFRATPQLQMAVVDPFPSRWAFDVFLLNRLLHAGTQLTGRQTSFLESPLEEWHDVGQSKVGIIAGIRALLDLRLVRNDAKTMTATPSLSCFPTLSSDSQSETHCAG